MIIEIIRFNRKYSFSNLKVIINGQKNDIQPTIFIIEDNKVSMITITPNHDFDITDEGLVGERYDANGNWCYKNTPIESLLKKSDIRIFGEDSISHVEKRGNNQYILVRDCDGVVLAYGDELQEYIDCTIRTMYTGELRGTGDYILEADAGIDQKEIYKFKD